MERVFHYKVKLLQSTLFVERTSCTAYFGVLVGSYISQYLVMAGANKHLKE